MAAGQRSKRILGVPDEFWIAFVIMIGIFLKLIYAINADPSVAGYGLGQWLESGGEEPHSGTLGVIQYYCTHRFLPDFDPRLVSGFVNPPLYSLISAVFMGITHGLLGWSTEVCLHLLMCLNAFYVTAASFGGIRLLFRYGIRGRALTVGILVLTFFPGMYNLTAVIGPEALAFMLTMLTVTSAFDWFETRKKTQMTGTAVLFGLAMMTGYQAVMILPLLGLIFYTALRDGRRYRAALPDQLKRFGLISGTMSLLWPVYNLIRFGLPPFSPEPVREAWQSLEGSCSLLQRVLFPPGGAFDSLHLIRNPQTEYNIWAQTFKTAAVDYQAVDLSSGPGRFFAGLILGLSIALCLLWHLMWIREMIRNPVRQPLRLFLAAGYLSMLFLYLVWCLARDSITAMTFRLIPGIFFFPLIGMSLGGEGASGDLFHRILFRISSWGALIFAAVTAFTFGFFP